MRHGQGEKRALREGEYGGETPASVVGLYRMRLGVIHATGLGDLKGADDCSGNGGEYLAGVRVTRAQATCWCERSVVDVTWEEVAEGVTRSCGSARCDAMEQAEMTGGLR